MKPSFPITKRLVQPVILASVAGLALLPALTLGQYDETALEPPSGEGFQQDVAWSPDGEWIAFSEYVHGREYSLDRWSVHVVKADGSQRRKLADSARFVTWSRDGKKLAFSSTRDGNADIFVINRDGTGLERITEHEAKDNLPAWSPTEDKIAFCSTRDGNEDIYVMNADGSGLVRLTEDPANDFNPSWSPDGRRLAFHRARANGKCRIWIVNADGTGERVVTDDDRHSVYPAFLPDRTIAFSSTDGHERGIFRVDPSSGARTEVENVSGFYARWSPDGKKIAFISGRWPKTAIYLTEPQSSVVRKIVN